MATQTLERIFIFKIGDKDQELPDPNSKMTEQEVKNFYALQYPEILNSNLDSKKVEDDKIKYRYTSKFGTKG